MVGPEQEAVEAAIGRLADICRDKKIVELDADLFIGERRVAVRVKMHELALRAPSVSLSPQPATAPVHSNSQAKPDANPDNLRFRSGSP
jgi:hypothetical protein